MNDITLGNFVAGGFPSQFYIDDLKVFDPTFTPTLQCPPIIGGAWNAALSSCTMP